MLDARKRQILKAIIQDYIFTAEPVGSRALVKRHDIGLSPATIRNEMADLEELGYLEQPHTSAGRIPSHNGYRFYVHSLMEDMELTGDDLFQLKNLISEVSPETNQFPRQIAKLLSSLTSYISLIAEPSDKDRCISHVDIIPRTNDLGTMIVVLNDGIVKFRSVTLPDGLQVSQIKALTTFVNHHLQGVPLAQISDSLLRGIKSDFAGNIAVVDHIIKLVQFMLDSENENLVVDGAVNMLQQPEFNDVGKVRELLQSLEQNDLLLQLLNAGRAEADTIIKIGSEIGLDSFNNCSLVVTAFKRNNKNMTIGILGPTRMDYAKTLSFIKVLREYLNSFGGIGND